MTMIESGYERDGIFYCMKCDCNKLLRKGVIPSKKARKYLYVCSKCGNEIEVTKRW